MTARAPLRIRAKQILLRVTTDEHEAIAKAAKAVGLGVGPWIRMVALRASGPSSAERAA